MHMQGMAPARAISVCAAALALGALIACSTVAASTQVGASAVAPARPPTPAAPVAGRQVPVAQGLAGMAFTPDGQRVLVTSNADNTLSEVDLPSGQVLRVWHDKVKIRTNDGCLDNFCRGAGAVGVVVSKDGRTAYVTSMREDAVSRLDLDKPQSTWATKVQRFPQSISLSPDGQTLWLFNLVANSISSVSTQNGKLTGKHIVLEGGSAHGLPFGRPASLALSADGSRLFVTSGLADAMDVYDTRTRLRVARTTPGAPFSIATDPLANQVWTQHSDGLLVFDGQTLQAKKAMHYCRDLTSYHFALSADGQYLAISLPEENLALVVEREGGLLTHALRTGDWPAQLAFTPDSRQLVVLNGGEQGGGLSILDMQATIDMAPYLAEAGELFCRPEEPTQ